MQQDAVSMPEKERAYFDCFAHLVFGLHSFLDSGRLKIPDSLRRALNAIAFVLPSAFPKTLYEFTAWCHRPVSSWYPLPIPDEFNLVEPLLYDGRLSEEAQEFYFYLTEQMELSPALRDAIPQTALDNLRMIELRQRLKSEPDVEGAQQSYVQIRSFIIEHSWTTRDQLRAHSSTIFQELRNFYEDIPTLPLNDLAVCQQCGLLEWRDQRWQGIKPTFCSDHGSGSSHLRLIPNDRNLLRLKRGIHLRTYLPGRLELALFTLAENAHVTHLDDLLSVEHYPGLDTYDLRLSFSDGEIWAVDAKDHARAERLTRLLKPLYNESELFHTRAFYVIPDRRWADPDYRERIEHASASLPAALRVMPMSLFQQHVETKLERLAVPPRRKKSVRN